MTFQAKITHSGSKCILMLAPRAKHPDMPLGEVEVVVAGERYVARFAKIAVNVLLRDGKNVLTDVLRAMFGPTAGNNGTRFHVQFERRGDDWHMVPAPATNPEQKAA